MPLAEQVRAALVAAERDYTLGNLAEKAGLHVTGLSRFKNGHTTLSVENLERLACILGLTIIVKKSQKKT